MNLVELDRALRQLRLSGMAGCPRDAAAPSPDREDGAHRSRLRARQPTNSAGGRTACSSAATSSRAFVIPSARSIRFDFDFNKKMNRALVYELATARFIAQREDVLFLGPPGTGKSHLAQAIGRAAILQGYRVVYREAHTLLEELAEATLAGTRKDYLTELAAVPLLIIDDLGMRKLAAHRRRRSPGADHAPLRTRLHAADVESTSR